MDGKEVYKCIENAWRATNAQYEKSPCEELRCASNMIARMLAEVKNRMEAAEKENEQAGTMTTEEWLAWLNED